VASILAGLVEFALQILLGDFHVPHEEFTKCGLRWFSLNQ
jgi:hypothetical protein